VTEPRIGGRQDAIGERESAESPAKVPLTARLLLRDSLTARRAAAIIAAFTVAITVAGGVLERLLDHREYPTIGKGLWFALQTVTTVGYGDVTPKDSVGRFIGAVVMLAGIGFLAVVTASATAALIESRRRRFAAEAESNEARQLDQISQRLARIERTLEQRPAERPPDAAR
jgi:voltage-gated potassium channel